MGDHVPGVECNPSRPLTAVTAAFEDTEKGVRPCSARTAIAVPLRSGGMGVTWSRLPSSPFALGRDISIGVLSRWDAGCPASSPRTSLSAAPLMSGTRAGEYQKTMNTSTDNRLHQGSRIPVWVVPTLSRMGGLRPGRHHSLSPASPLTEVDDSRRLQSRRHRLPGRTPATRSPFAFGIRNKVPARTKINKTQPSALCCTIGLVLRDYNERALAYSEARCRESAKVPGIGNPSATPDAYADKRKSIR